MAVPEVALLPLSEKFAGSVPGQEKKTKKTKQNNFSFNPNMHKRLILQIGTGGITIQTIDSNRDAELVQLIVHDEVKYIIKIGHI